MLEILRHRADVETRPWIWAATENNLAFDPVSWESGSKLPHHDQQTSDDENQTQHGRMLFSNMLLLNPILPIDVTFSTPTPVHNSFPPERTSCWNRDWPPKAGHCKKMPLGEGRAIRKMLSIK